MRKVSIVGVAIVLVLSLALAGTILAQSGGQSDTASKTWLGVYVAETSDGVVVTRVVKNSPAEAGGLLVDDVIVQFDEQVIDSAQALVDAVEAHAEGDVVSVVVKRGDSEETLDITLGSSATPSRVRTDELSADMAPLVMAESVLHVELSAVDGGYQVLADEHVRTDALLLVDDVITAVNDTPIAEVDWPTLYTDLASQDSPVVTLTVQRAGEEITVEFDQFGRLTGDDHGRSDHGAPNGRDFDNHDSNGRDGLNAPGNGNSQNQTAPHAVAPGATCDQCHTNTPNTVPSAPAGVTSDSSAV